MGGKIAKLKASEARRARVAEALPNREEEAKRLVQENAIMAEIGRIISSTLNIEEVYERFAIGAKKLIPFNRIIINLISREKGTITNAYISGTEVAGRRPGDVLPLRGSLNEKIMSTRKSMLIQTEDPEELARRFPTLMTTFQAGLRSMMSVPLLSQDQVIGVLHFRSSQANAYTEKDIKLAESIAAQIAGAIANALLFLERKRAEEALRRSEEEAKRLAQENAIMAEIGQIISSTLNIEEVYERFAETVRKLIPFDRIAINAINPEGTTFIIPYVLGSNVAERELGKVIPLAGTGAQWVMQNRTSMLILEENWEEITGRFPGLLPLFRAGFCSVMLIPLFSKDQVIAVLNLQTLKRNAYTEADLKLAERVGTQVAGAIANAMLFLEHKRAEETLRENEERFRLVAKSSTDVIYEWDIKEHVDWFGKIDELLGYAPNEFPRTFEAWANSVHPDDRDRVMAAVKNHLEKNEPFDIEYRIMKKDGTYNYWWARGTAAGDEKGIPYRWIGAITDITERKGAEEVLRRSEEEAKRLAKEAAVLAEIGRIISSTLDIEEVYGWFAQEALKLIPFDRISINLINLEEGTVVVSYVAGLDIPERRSFDVYLLKDSVTEKIRGNRLSLLIQPETREELEGQFPKFISHFQAGLRSMMGIPLVSRDAVIGVLYLYSRKLKAYTDQELRLAERISSQIAGAIANAQLFAEHRQTEEALQASEEQYRLLVQNSNDAIFIAQDGVIKFPNLKTEELLGYSAAELARIPFVNHIHPDDREMVLENHKKRLAGQKFPGTYSFKIKNKMGGELWVEINAVLMQWEGRPATLNFLRDITEKKKLEAQFLQAQKMEAVGTLAGGIAHDFNNLLMGIQGHTSLIILGVDPSHRHYKMLKSIEEQVKSGADLTWQLLSFARGGKYEVKPADLNAIIKKTSSMFGRTRKEITIYKNFQQDLWPVEVDRGQIEQVLLNLYLNAWQAMPSGGLLSLETKNVTLDENYSKSFYVKPGNYVKISVADTGVGMDEKTQRRIFEPFFTTREMGRGTGLGLATAYGIIKGHGGVINVYSEKGHGATFNIYLPVSEKKVEKEGKSSEELLRGKETILLVDDEEVVLNVSRMVLERLGYKVLMARNGQEAIEVYKTKKEEIDLVILDLIMPTMGGEKTFDLLKTINPDLKVILSSGYSLNGQAAQIMERGCKGFIQKPFGAGELSQKIREVLDNGVKDQPEPDKTIQ